MDNCKRCEKLLTEEEKSHVERLVEDHEGFCCDCYNIHLGKPDPKSSIAVPREGAAYGGQDVEQQTEEVRSQVPEEESRKSQSV
jgi:hypothetical protein